jgi:hypothetical protein
MTFRSVLKFFGFNSEENTMNKIVPLNGKFAILDRQGFTVKTYSRKRDAFRGAERMGLTIG